MKVGARGIGGNEADKAVFERRSEPYGALEGCASSA